MLNVDEKSRFVNFLRAAFAAVCAACIVAAGLAAYLANRLPPFRHSMMTLVLAVDDSLHLTKLSSGSNFPDMTAIYDLIIYPLPLFLASFFVSHLAFPLQGRMARPYVFKHYVVAIFMIPFFLFLVSIPYWAGQGEDIRFIKFGTQLNQLILFGWVPFGVSGSLLGLTAVIAGKLITRK